jgi:hypothetical protein
MPLASTGATTTTTSIYCSLLLLLLTLQIHKRADAAVRHSRRDTPASLQACFCVGADIARYNAGAVPA